MKVKIRNWLLASLVIAGILSLFASSHPDGFEKAGEQTGYIDKAANYLSSPFPDYSIPGIGSWISSSLAGIIGVAVTFVLFLLLGKWIGRKSK